MLRIGQVEVTATSDGKYTDGSVAAGVAATRLRAAAFNAIQEELAHIVELAGLALNVADNTQVYAALQKLFLSRANPFADIKADGNTAIAAALSNLGLGEAAKRDVGTGALQIPDMSLFASLINVVSPSQNNGSQKLPGGIMFQWVRIPASAFASATLVSGNKYRLDNISIPQAFSEIYFATGGRVPGSGVAAYAVSVYATTSLMTIVYDGGAKQDDTNILLIGKA